MLGNFLGYQAVWWSAVYGAAHGSPWPGIAAAALFTAAQLALSRRRTADLGLLGVALLLGVLLDGTLAGTGLVRYAAADPSLPRGGAPGWILALWVAFALTLNHSLSWLRARPLAGAILGAIGGPLAYAGAARLAALSFAAPAWHGAAALAAGWGAALALLAWLARAWARSGVSGAPRTQPP